MNGLAKRMGVVVAVAILTMPAATTLADEHAWTGLGDGTNWSDPANWSPAELPLVISIGDGADTVAIDGAYDVVVDADVISVNSIRIDGDATLTIASGVNTERQADRNPGVERSFLPGASIRSSTLRSSFVQRTLPVLRSRQRKYTSGQ